MSTGGGPEERSVRAGGLLFPGASGLLSEDASIVL